MYFCYNTISRLLIYIRILYHCSFVKCPDIISFLLNPHFIVAPYVVFTFLFIVVCEPAVRPVGLGWGEGGGGTHTCTFMFSAKHMLGHVRSLNSRGGIIVGTVLLLRIWLFLTFNCFAYSCIFLHG